MISSVSNPKNLLIVGNLAKDVIFGQESYGGSAFNIAANAQQLGIQTGILSILGRDTFSKEYLSFLSNKCVDTTLIFTLIDKLPECIVTSVNNTNADSIWIDNNSHNAMSKLNIEENLLTKYSLIHLVSCSPLLAKRISSIPNINLSYEPGPKLLIDDSYFDYDVYHKSRFIFFNEEEYLQVQKMLSLKTPHELIEDSNRVIIVTLGSKGSKIYFKKNDVECEITIASSRISKVVDFTGAGDCYKAGFLAAFLHGYDLASCGEVASTLASCSIEQLGGLLPMEVLCLAKRLIINNKSHSIELSQDDNRLSI